MEVLGHLVLGKVSLYYFTFEFLSRFSINEENYAIQKESTWVYPVI